MIYDVLIEWRENDDQLWHAVTTTRARNMSHAFQKITRLAPFSKITVCVCDCDLQDIAVELDGDKKMTGELYAMMLPEFNGGVQCDRRPIYKDGEFIGESDLTFVEEEKVALRIREMLDKEL